MKNGSKFAFTLAGGGFNRSIAWFSPNCFKLRKFNYACTVLNMLFVVQWPGFSQVLFSISAVRLKLFQASQSQTYKQGAPGCRHQKVNCLLSRAQGGSFPFNLLCFGIARLLLRLQILSKNFQSRVANFYFVKINYNFFQHRCFPFFCKIVSLCTFTGSALTHGGTGVLFLRGFSFKLFPSRVSYRFLPLKSIFLILKIFQNTYVVHSCMSYLSQKGAVSWFRGYRYVRAEFTSAVKLSRLLLW